jgi:Putative zinc-finger
MNCSHIRAHLPQWLYGDLPPDAAAQVAAHLAICADCRREGEALKQVRQALDAVPAATAEVDLPRLYRTVAQTQERRLRRWRRIALTLGGLAAALVLLAALPSLEVRCEDHQFVVRWGAPPPLPPAVQPVPPPPHESEVERPQFVSVTAPDVEDSLRKLSDLVQLLADDASKRDERSRRELETLRAQLKELRVSMDRDVAALYAVQFSETKKGKMP